MGKPWFQIETGRPLLGESPPVTVIWNPCIHNCEKYVSILFNRQDDNFKNIRKSGSNTLTGNRIGKQVFGSLQYTKSVSGDKIDISPNIRLDLSSTSLSQYSEIGTNALYYGKQTVETVGFYSGLTFNNELLKNENYSIARDYLKNRSLSKDEVKKFKIGYIEKNPNFFEKLNIWNGNFNLRDLDKIHIKYALCVGQQPTKL